MGIRAAIFGELRNVVLVENGKEQWSKKVTYEEVLERIGEKRILLNIILS